jgi:hypothetical protein
VPTGIYEPLELPELAPAELPAPLEPAELLAECMQRWVPADPGMAPMGGVPAEADEEGDDDGDDVTAVVDAVAAAPAPPVDASATPVAPAPTPAAATAVMMSRRVRPPILETMGFLPSRRSPSATVGGEQPARRA